MGMSFLWESHGKRPMGWDRHILLWDGNGTDKYVPWTTLEKSSHVCAASRQHVRISNDNAQTNSTGERKTAKAVVQSSPGVKSIRQCMKENLHYLSVKF